MHACTHCRPESQNSSTSLIPLSRFTAMLMWDLYQNGWCKAQTGPMSQLASLRNGSTRTSTHAQTRGSTIPFSSPRLTIFLSQTLLHIHYLLNAVSHTHTCTNILCSPLGHCLWPLRQEKGKKNAEMVEIKKVKTRRRMSKRETGAASQTVQN